MNGEILFLFLMLHLFSFVLELSVNGELDSIARGGFKRIVIHLKSDQHVKVDPREVTIREGQTETSYTGQDVITSGRCLCIIMNYAITSHYHFFLSFV